MGNTKFNYVMGLISGIALTILIFVLLVPLGESGGGGGGVSLPTPAAFNRQSADIDWDDFIQKIDQIYNVIGNNFIGDFNTEMAVDMMFRAFVYGANDPYTSYLDAVSFSNFMTRFSGEFYGIGVTVVADPTDNRILVITPHEGSPACEAGILPGDRIVRVNGISVFGDRLDDAVAMMRGEVGTPVDVTVLRNGHGEIDFNIIRDVIRSETVRGEMLDGDIGYIRITGFDAITASQFEEIYNRLVAENMQALILDVRNNGGGSMDAVIEIADMIVPQGLITYTINAHGRRQDHRSDARQTEVPLIMLMNGNSASASEVLGGAVQDSGIGYLLGTTSFGKGVIQRFFPLPDGSAVRVTIARYYTPSGNSIDGEGLVPDFYIEMDQELTNRLVRLDRADDVQLQEAIRILNEKIQ